MNDGSVCKKWHFVGFSRIKISTNNEQVYLSVCVREREYILLSYFGFCDFCCIMKSNNHLLENQNEMAKAHMCRQ